MAELPVHSVGILVTDRPTTDGPPDAHSFRLVDSTVLEVAGWARTGRLPLPSRNPPEGSFTSLYAPLPDGLTDADRTAIHGLLVEHRHRYGEVSIYITDNHRAGDDLNRWVSTGSQPGSTIDSTDWGATSTDPADHDPGAAP